MKLIKIIVSGFLFFTVAIVHAAENQRQFKSLHQQVQMLKNNVVDINRDLKALEAKVLNPSSTQLNVFVSMDVGEFFALESVKVQIDNATVASHIYSEREAKALARGAVQRIFMGNYRPGRHELVAVFTGKGPQGREYRRATRKKIQKSGDAHYVELRISDSVKKRQPEFYVYEW
jgi:hypothetical protein